MNTRNNKRKKILIVSQSYPPDFIRGAEIVASQMADYLNIDSDVHVLALGDEVEYSEKMGYPLHRIVYHNHPRPQARDLAISLPKKFIWHILNSIGGVDKNDIHAVLKEINPDVVYIHNAYGFQPQLFQECDDLKIPVVVHVYDYSILCPKTTMYRSGINCSKSCVSCSIFTYYWRKYTGSVRDVISPSAFVAKRLREYGVFPNARWHVIQNIDNTPVEGFVKKSSGPFTFGFIGALTDEKGLGDLISAFASKGFESSELVIAGQGKDAYVSKMKSRVAMQPVRWLGQVSPNELYSAIDCLVVPSRWNEPLGLIVAEAQKRGIPIIASDRGGIPEILQDCPENMLFEPDSKGGLREAMLRMLSERPVGKPKSKEGELKFFESVEAIIKCI